MPFVWITHAANSYVTVHITDIINYFVGFAVELSVSDDLFIFITRKL